MNILIEPHYLPGIPYFSLVQHANKMIIDDVSPFKKQSYRNRCVILGANGPMDLIIPVHGSRSKLPIREIQIDNHIHWQHQHWQSIRSAYGKTAFFEHYAHKLADFYNKPYAWLFDFDMEIFIVLLGILKIDQQKISVRSEDNTEDYSDFGNTLDPKSKPTTEPQDHTRSYHQAFEGKFGFLDKMSMIDLIFNEGPRWREVVGY